MMARNPAPTKEQELAGTRADRAFGAAIAFVEHLAAMAVIARSCSHHANPNEGRLVAFDFARAFIAWSDLKQLLTPEVCAEARRVYPPDASPIRLCASDSLAPAVPAGPQLWVDALDRYRCVKLGESPYLTVIEAVAVELGNYFRNAVYLGRRHPLDPDLERLEGEAKARATAREVAEGRPAEPMGYGAELEQLIAQETRAVVLGRLGIKTRGDLEDLMMREWNDQDRMRGESALWLLRCDPINFPDLRVQLMREAEAVSKRFGELRSIPAAMPESKTKRSRKRPIAKQQRGITPKESLAVKEVLKNSGNYAAAAKALGISRSTLRENYARGQEKIKATTSPSRSVSARYRLPEEKPRTKSQ